MNLLVLSPILPHAPVDGDRMRIWHWLRLLRARGHRLTLACVARSDWETQNGRARELEAMLEGRLHVEVLGPARLALNAARAMATGRPLNVEAYRSPAFAALVRRLAAEGGFDAALAYRLRMAPYALQCGLPAALDFCDAMSWYAAQREAACKEGSLRQAWWAVESHRLMAYETGLAGRLAVFFANGAADAQHLGRLMGPAAEVRTLPNGVDFDYHAPDPAEPRTPGAMVFVGQMGYAPNHQAVAAFHAGAFQVVGQARPDARLWVVGGGMPAGLAARLRRDPRVTLAGFVPDVRPWVRRAQVALCTVQSGAGRQNKLLEAMAAGTPAVASRLAAAGAEAADGEHLLVADGPEAEARAALRLMAEPALANRLAEAARRFVVERYDWERSGDLLDAALRGLARA